MTKKEIVKQISDRIGLTQLKTKEIVQQTFDAIVDTLIAEKRIELRNFGVFEVKKRKARKARNPRTGDKVDVPPKFVVTFKPGKEMEERVRQLTQATGRNEQAEREEELTARDANGDEEPAEILTMPLSPVAKDDLTGTFVKVLLKIPTAPADTFLKARRLGGRSGVRPTSAATGPAASASNKSA